MPEKATKNRAVKTVKSKSAATKTSVKKPRTTAVKKTEAVETTPAIQQESVGPATPVVDVVSIPSGKYIFATGRRKTAVANIRLFGEPGEGVVNKKPISKYFDATVIGKVLEPFRLLGVEKNYRVVANIQGGGKNSQAEAMRHGIAQALAGGSEGARLIMKKNGFLTRDDRKKERKKPGLKRARRSPQWAKR